MTQIDTSALRRLLNVIGGDVEDLTEFIDDYAEIAPELFAQIKDGVAISNWNAVKIAAHSLKSNSNDLGASTLANLCSGIEHESAQGGVENIEEKIIQIAVEMEKALAALRTIDLETIG